MKPIQSRRARPEPQQNLAPHQSWAYRPGAGAWTETTADPAHEATSTEPSYPPRQGRRAERTPRSRLQTVRVHAHPAAPTPKDRPAPSWPCDQGGSPTIVSRLPVDAASRGGLARTMQLTVRWRSHSVPQTPNGRVKQRRHWAGITREGMQQVRLTDRRLASRGYGSLPANSSSIAPVATRAARHIRTSWGGGGPAPNRHGRAISRLPANASAARCPLMPVLLPALGQAVAAPAYSVGHVCGQRFARTSRSRLFCRLSRRR